MTRLPVRALLLAAALLPMTLAALPARTMKMTVDVQAPLQEIWDKFTTEEGMTSWMVAKAEVDWRVGGTIRTHYDPEAEIGDEGTIVHHILSYEPLRMYSSRFTAPENTPIAKVAEATWGVVRFEPLTPDRTRVRFTSLGWGEGEEWDKAWEFFLRGNRWTLHQLLVMYPGSRMVPAEPKGRQVLELLGPMAGGEWIHEGTDPNGNLFLARNRIETGPDGSSLFSKGWLGGEDGMFLHGHSQIWLEPVSGAVRFQNLNERGDLARGEIELQDERTLVWHWNLRQSDGGGRYLRILMRLDGKDAYTMTMQEPDPEGGFRSLMEADFRRVDRLPRKFRRGLN